MKPRDAFEWGQQGGVGPTNAKAYLSHEGGKEGGRDVS